MRYVEHSNGTICAQFDSKNEWGFTLVTEDATYPGGFGLGNGTWKEIPGNDPRISDELRYIAEEFS